MSAVEPAHIKSAAPDPRRIPRYPASTYCIVLAAAGLLDEQVNEGKRDRAEREEETPGDLVLFVGLAALQETGHGQESMCCFLRDGTGNSDAVGGEVRGWFGELGGEPGEHRAQARRHRTDACCAKA